MKDESYQKKPQKKSNIAPAEPAQEEDQIILPILRSEFNLLKYPFFDLSKTGERDSIEIRKEMKGEEGEAELLWEVTRNIKYDLPSAFDKKVYRAVEQIINRLKKPIQNPIRLGSLRDLYRSMEIGAEGKNVIKAKEALKKISLTGVQARGTFYLKDDKRHIDDTFHIYNRVIFTGEELSDGTEADAIYLFLGSYYLQNLNVHYVVPLDFDFYRSLRGNIAPRMYEYIGLMFYAALENNQGLVRVRYSTICEYFPLTRQLKKWKAKQQLRRAHQQLKESKYFSKVQWQDTEEKQDWLLRYFIGKRAISEWKKNKERPLEEQLQFQLQEPILDEANVEEGKDDTPSDLTSELCNRGISKAVAKRLADFFPPEYITQKIEVLDKLTMIDSPYVRHNPAGWLRKAIEENYELSPEQKRRIKKQAGSKESKIKENALKARAKEIRKQRIEEAEANFPDRDKWVQNEVDRAVADRNELVKNLSDRQPYTEEEIEAMKEEYSKRYPETQQERRSWLERQLEYGIKAIVKELKAKEETQKENEESGETL